MKFYNFCIVGDFMYNLTEIELKFVIGIIKELYKKEKITEKQMLKAVNEIKIKNQKRGEKN